MRANGEQLKIGAVTDAGQIYSSNKLTLHFQVPLATPLDPKKAKFMLKVYDPEFFIDFEYPKDDGADVTGNMPKQCKLAHEAGANRCRTRTDPHHAVHQGQGLETRYQRGFWRHVCPGRID